MNARSSRVLTKAAFTWAALFLLVGSGLAQSSSSKDTGTETKAPIQNQQSTADNSKFIGSESCKKCHEFLFKGFERTKHFQLVSDTRRGPAFQGCEGCHGPGRAHAESGGDPQRIRSFK